MTTRRKFPEGWDGWYCVLCGSPVLLRRKRWPRRAERSLPHGVGVLGCTDNRVYLGAA